ncbi:MAG TPA: transcriptional repressor [Solirubrobacteraceae bacterium]|nr:transcriptional repressor [Solirubrobacteraceae bacterium]
MASDNDPGDILRAQGLRVTPQRRAILGAFSGAAAEHLAADEVHARAAAAVPELGRGTVYATLAELTEIGVLVASGSPDPVRYETNTAPHQHFRCRVCLRLFDVDMPESSTDSLSAQGFAVEQVTVTADGICAECVAYDRGLRAGARRARTRPSDLPDDIAAATVETPVGALTLAATPRGLVRAVFDGHADVPQLQEVIRRRRGSRAARAQLDMAKAAVADYFAGRPMRDCEIDWAALADIRTLRAVPAGKWLRNVSYETLDTDASPEQRGRALGANPLAVFVSCHRVTRGAEVPDEYVGGVDRRLALSEIDRALAARR